MKAINTFKENIKATDLFTARVHAMSSYLTSKDAIDYPKYISPEILKFVNFDDKHFDKIFEVGFISLFANFEFFMYEFLKELYKKYPKSLPLDKVVRVEELILRKSYRSIHEYIVDSTAIENSYDLEIWSTICVKNFNIRPFSDEMKVRLMIMNSQRNMVLHSGGHWNSKIEKDSKKINRAFAQLPKDIREISKKGESEKDEKKDSKLTPKIAYVTTIDCFRHIIKEISTQMKGKRERKRNDK